MTIFTPPRKLYVMSSKRVYTYYWWFIIIVFCFLPAIVYLSGAEVYKQYTTAPFGIAFWTTLFMTFFLLLVAIGYCSHMLTYRLVYHEDKVFSSSAWTNLAAFIDNYLTRFSFWHSNAVKTPTTLSADFHVSLFCNGHAYIKREVALQNYLVMSATNQSYCPPVPSLRTYRINQWHQMILIIFIPMNMVLVMWMGFYDKFQWVQLLFHTAITYYGIYIYRYSRLLPVQYFPLFRQNISSWLIPLLIFWILLYPKGILTKYTISGYLPFIVPSIILSIITYQFFYSGGWRTFRSRLYDRSQYLLLVCLTFTFFNILVSINCIPPTASVYTLHLPVQVSEDTDPSTSETSTAVKTIPVTFYGGMLGVPWYSDKNIKEDK